ncbi:MAG: protein kinase [Proteobacteria bacterium]|nr:protein kinase [Pseudomonadota bacterium]
MKLPAGTIIGDRYVVEALAGAGGMGSVYKAHDRAGRPVAIKVLQLQSVHFERRFAREATLLSQLDDPAIVRYHDSGITSGGQRYLVMEWLDGVGLDVALRETRFTIAQILHLIGRIARAMGVAHERGIVHRDVKPGNIFLVGGVLQAAKLLDFGLAGWADATQGLTVAGTRFGTPAYMSPEQVRGRILEVDARADVFALGCVLFECLTGEPAFAAHDPMAVFCKILMAPVPSAAALCPEVPKGIEALVQLMLDKDPAERPSNGRAVAARIDEIVAGLPETTLALQLQRPVSRVLTDSEQRWANVILAHVTSTSPASSEAHTVPDGASSDLLATEMFVPDERANLDILARLSARMEALGAKCSGLGDGSLIAVLESAEATQAGTAIDQTVNAARCALLIHREFPAVCVGVASGRAAMGEDRLIDDLIDRAVKLVGSAFSGCAGPGTNGPVLRSRVRIDEVTYKLIESRFQTAGDEVGGRILLDEYPFDSALSVLGRSTPFVGRKRELSTLNATIEECVEEGIARLALVTSPAGFGKSRLRYELQQCLGRDHDNLEIWLSHGDPMRAGSPMGIVSEAIRRACAIAESEPAGVRRSRLERRVAQHVPAEHTHRVSVFLGELLRVPAAAEDLQLRAARRDPQLMSDQVRQACLDLFGAQTRAGPLVLILDDLHWGDGASIKLLDAAMAELVEQPLAIVAFGRPEVQERFPGIWTRHNCTVVHLGRLPRRSSEKLARAVLGDKVSQERVAALVARADGNAFYLEELVRNAAAGRWELPDTVQAMVETRLGLLHQEARRVLRAASVFGQRFWLGAVQVLVGDDCAAEAWLYDLVQDEMLNVSPQSRFAGEVEYSFRHSLIRDGAYSMLTDDDRQLGHRLAGEWLEGAGETDGQFIAQHFERGGALDRAIPHFLRAAENALDRSDFNKAIELAQRGIGCGADAADLGAFKRVFIEERIWRGKTADLAELCTETMALLPRGSREWYDVLGEAGMVAGRRRNVTQIEELSEMLDQMRDSNGDQIGWQLAVAKLAAQLFMVNSIDPGQALRTTDRGYALLAMLEDRIGEPERADPVVAAHLHFARARSPAALDDPSMMLVELEQCAARFAQIGDRRQAALQRNNVGYAKSELGLFEEAESDLRSALADAERLSLDLAVNAVRESLAVVLARSGDYSHSAAHLRAAIAGFEEQGDERLVVWSMLELAGVLLAAGYISEAEKEARKALARAAESSSLRPLAVATVARVDLARGKSQDALEWARTAVELLDALDAVESGESLVRLVYAEALDACGDRKAAREAIALARHSLQQRANKIGQPEWQKSFLENIPDHARTIELAERWHREALLDPAGDGVAVLIDDASFEPGSEPALEQPRIQLCLLCPEFADVGGLCRNHIAAISQCEHLTSEQILSREPVEPEAWLIDQWGATHGMSPDTAIGRSLADTDITVLHPSVSSLHARIQHTGDTWYLIDLDSLNGSFRNRERVIKSPLADGDRIAFGNVNFYFTSSSVAPITGVLGPGRTMRLNEEETGITKVIELDDGRTVEFTLRIDGGIARVGGAMIEFTALEFGLLHSLIERRVERGDLELAFMSWQELSKVLAFKSRAADSENVRELVRRVRRKLKKAGIPNLIESRQRVGYRLAPEVRVIR